MIKQFPNVSDVFVLEHKEDPKVCYQVFVVFPIYGLGVDDEEQYLNRSNINNHIKHLVKYFGVYLCGIYISEADDEKLKLMRSRH
jgi:hypothetical protein